MSTIPLFKNRDESNTTIDDQILYLDRNCVIGNLKKLELYLLHIFDDQEFSHFLANAMGQTSIDLQIFTINDLIGYLKETFNQQLDWRKPFSQTNLQRLIKLLEFEQSLIESLYQYRLEGKPTDRLDAVFWPNPTHKKYPATKYQLLPFVEKHPILTRDTVIASAGSCFATEFSRIIKSRGFNYLRAEVCEPKPPGEDELVVAPGTAGCSAHFGTLFNTGSLKQLAERGFEKRNFKPLLVEMKHGLFADPYRQGIFFQSKQQYFDDIPKHQAAVKRVLTESEVFVFTAGLNECWRLFDGTYLAQNPTEGLHHLIQHEVMTVEQNIENICYFFDTVKEFNPKFKLILTLSPVPLLATGRAGSHHIIEANVHSKAVLRVAIDEVVNRYEDIYYLPSYELVTECSEDPWEKDHRHVKRSVVKRVLDMFEEIFLIDSA